MMQHEYGVKPTEIHWRSGGQEEPGRDERTPLKPIPGLDLKPIGKEQTLVGMLRDGELDALFTARAPSSFLRGEPHIQRLFPNTREAEQAYYKKTKMFPIMHLVGIRKELVQQYPWLPSSVYKAFCEAKALAMTDLLDVNALMVTLAVAHPRDPGDHGADGQGLLVLRHPREHAGDRGAGASTPTSRA